MFTVNIFSGTGFSMINGPLPGSELDSILRENITDGWNKLSVVFRNVQISDINDPFHIEAIKIPASVYNVPFPDIFEKLDYARIECNGNFYFYFVMDFRFTSSDVMTLSLSIDPFMTSKEPVVRVHGGQGTYKDRINTPTGVITRLNTPQVTATPYLTDDMYQLSGPPTYHVDQIWSSATSRGTTALVALAIDPQQITSEEFAAIKEVKSEETEYGKTKGTTTITPAVEFRLPNPSEIRFNVPQISGNTVQNTVTAYMTQGYSLFRLSGAAALSRAVEQAIQILNALDMGDAIIGAYEIPTATVTISGSAVNTAVVNLEGNVDRYTTPYTPKALFPEYPWAELIYCCKDFTYTVSGIASGDSLTDQAVNCAGTVYSFVDPRPDGRPYFIFPAANMVSASAERATLSALQGRTVHGANWQKAAIALTKPSGSYLGQILTSINQRRIEQDYQTTERQMTSGFIPRLIQNLGGVGGELGATAAVGGLESLAAVPTAFINAGVSTIASTLQNYVPGMLSVPGVPNLSEQDLAWFSPLARAKQAAAREMIDEKLRYLGNYVYRAPAIKSQPQETIQQFSGNGALFTACVPSLFDVARFGVVFAMFGRKTSIPTISNSTPVVEAAENAPSIFLEMQVADNPGNSGFLYKMQVDRLQNGYRFWRRTIKSDENAYDPNIYWE